MNAVAARVWVAVDVHFLCCRLECRYWADDVHCMHVLATEGFFADVEWHFWHSRL